MDEDNSNSLEADEIYSAFQNIGMPRTKAECKELIDSRGKKKPGSLILEEFEDFMKPMMLDQLNASTQKEQDLRRVFLKADTDHSGQLDITEMYEALRDMGA